MKSKLWITLVVVLVVSLLVLMMGQLESRLASVTAVGKWLQNYGGRFGWAGLPIMLILFFTFCTSILLAILALRARRLKGLLVAGAVVILTATALTQPKRVGYLTSYYSEDQIRYRNMEAVEKHLHQFPAFADVEFRCYGKGEGFLYVSICGTVPSQEDLDALEMLINSKYADALDGNPDLGWEVKVGATEQNEFSKR